MGIFAFRGRIEVGYAAELGGVGEEEREDT